MDTAQGGHGERGSRPGPGRRSNDCATSRGGTGPGAADPESHAARPAGRNPLIRILTVVGIRNFATNSKSGRYETGRPRPVRRRSLSARVRMPVRLHNTSRRNMLDELSDMRTWAPSLRSSGPAALYFGSAMRGQMKSQVLARALASTDSAPPGPWTEAACLAGLASLVWNMASIRSVTA